MATRRNFIRNVALGSTGIALAGGAFAGTVPGRNQRKIHAFTKCLQFLDFNEMAEVLAGLGFDGADLTVRPGGQVLPERVEQDLPRAVKALRNQGVDSGMITTSIVNAVDPFTERILKTMAELGIHYYRTGYFSYDPAKSPLQNLEIHTRAAKKLEQLNRKYKVCGNYQNHSGTQVGGPVWDLYFILKDLDPDFMGVQYDIRHATVEGGTSWPLGLKLLAPWIRTTDIKDFIWQQLPDGKWEIKNVPLGEGMVDFHSYLGNYKELGTDAPVSIHYEYDLGGAEHGSINPEMDLNQIKIYLKKDLEYLKTLFGQYNL